MRGPERCVKTGSAARAGTKQVNVTPKVFILGSTLNGYDTGPRVMVQVMIRVPLHFLGAVG